MHNIVLFVAVMLLTFLFLREVAAAEPPQDPDNTCYIDSSCKAAGSINNPFEENSNG